MNILLHADGGIGVGLGHASRCSALAIALRRQGHVASVLVDPSKGLVDYLSRLQVPVIEGPANSASLQVHADRLNAGVIVIDSYRWYATDFTDVRQNGRIVVAFDDEARRNLPVDAVINGAPAAVSLDYQTFPHTRLWLGLPYQVIREEFRNVPFRKPTGAVRRVIVLVGGDDSLGLLPQLAQRLDAVAAKCKPQFKVQLICGPYARMPDTDVLSHVETIQHPLDLRDRMLSADMALSASGQTLYELARCGTPTIAFCSGEDQVHNLAALAEAGVVYDSGDASRPGWLDTVEEVIRTLATDQDRRDNLSTVAQRLMDGRGADRLVIELQRLVADKITCKK